MLSKLLRQVSSQKRQQRDAELYRNLIRHEARIGGQVFGDPPKGGRREFFCLDEHTWVWHEEWIDQSGQRRIRTTRYDVRPNQIIKSQNGEYHPLSLEEAERLGEAARLYCQKVNSQLYAFAN